MDFVFGKDPTGMEGRFIAKKSGACGVPVGLPRYRWGRYASKPSHMWSSGGDATTQARHTWTLRSSVVFARLQKRHKLGFWKKKLGRILMEDPKNAWNFQHYSEAICTQSFLPNFPLLSSLTGPPTSQIVQNDGLVNLTQKKSGFLAFEDLGGDV